MSGVGRKKEILTAATIGMMETASRFSCRNEAQLDEAVNEYAYWSDLADRAGSSLTLNEATEALENATRYMLSEKGGYY